MSYTHELTTGLHAVQLASHLTKRVLRAAVAKDSSVGSLNKSDASPVTIADFAAQAVIIAIVGREFPGDSFVGEEDAEALRADETLGCAVWEVVRSTLEENAEQGKGGLGNGLIRSKQEMFDLIDVGGGGNEGGGSGGKGKVWILDPVDGTSTFMRNQQYAVCLALVEDGDQKVGVLGCPNLKVGPAGQVSEDLIDMEGYGLLLSAVKGQGAFMRPMGPRPGIPGENAKKLAAPREIDDLSQLRWTDSVISSHITPAIHGRVAEILGAKWPGNDIWSMQMKYVALAIGACDVMIRVPPKETYRASVWDHAGGQLIYSEAGGVITDSDGKQFDFGLGRKLSANLGLTAASTAIHGRLLEAVTKAKAEAREAGSLSGE